MIEAILQNYLTQIKHLELLLMVINALVHVIFAGGVAKDAAMLNHTGRRPALVSAHIWAFATLIGGVVVAAIYWFIHHSTLTIEGVKRVD
jgi:uncharacterized membrane protein